MSGGEGGRFDVFGGGRFTLLDLSLAGGGSLPCDLSHDAFDVTDPLPLRTDESL